MAEGGVAGSIRARVRAEMTEEIKAVARRHLAADGANLSLRAVARDMGMVSSALYRYFASRDELLTALIIDSYDALGEAAEAADAKVADRADVLGRWLAVAHALRAWALAQPHEYALIYGSPVPGYAAPEDTIGPSTRPVLVMGRILADACRQGLAGADPLDAPPLPPALGAEVKAIADLVARQPSPLDPSDTEPRPGTAVRVPEPVMARGLIAWTEIFGAINFEVFGRLNKTIDEREAWYDHQARVMAALIGLRDQGAAPANRRRTAHAN